jgi:hypothetical protein
VSGIFLLILVSQLGPRPPLLYTHTLFIRKLSFNQPKTMIVVWKTSRKETTLVQRAYVWTRYLDGHRPATIAWLEGLPNSTVRDIIQWRLETEDPSFKSKPWNLNRKITSDRDNRALLCHALKHPKDTLYALGSPSKLTYKLSRNTVWKILKVYGKAKRKPCKKPYLKPEHKLKRVIWSKQEKRVKRDYNKVC